MAQAIRTGDGRTLELHELGDPGGFPVVHHHGTPGSGLLYGPWRTDGIRLIGYDRAGYAGSERALGRSIASVAADVEAIADALELDRFATWGISGGGPHAVACAALCDDRLTAAASLAGVAPFEADGLDWLAGMGADNVEEFDLVLAGEKALRPALDRYRDELAAITPDELRRTWDTLLGPADREACSGELAAYELGAIQHGLDASVDGWVDDDLAFAAPWGFDLDAIERPVLIVQGGDDRFVPKTHGAWLAAQVPGCEAWLADEHGHLTLLEHVVLDVHAWLLQHS